MSDNNVVLGQELSIYDGVREAMHAAGRGLCDDYVAEVRAERERAMRSWSAEYAALESRCVVINGELHGEAALLATYNELADRLAESEIEV